jgi:Dolichyl-phosphate-mannose-protein mannosyltransferase
MRSSFDRFCSILRGLVPAWARSERAALLAILALGIVVRLVARGSVPNGFNQDEASLGYDAWAILNYGIDRHNIPYPAFLIGWGSGMNALSAYLAMPFIALFGLDEGAIRAVNLLAGILSLVVFHRLVRRLADAKVALWAVFLLAICPWHIMLSRWALESNLLPAMFLFAVWFMVKGTERPRFFVLASLCFALALYAYGTAYFAVPVFLLLASVYFLWKRQIPWRWYAIGVGVFALVAVPIAATIWVNQKQLPSLRLLGIGIPRMSTIPRYKVISSLFGAHALDRCVENLTTLWHLVVKQDDGLIWNAIGGHGLLFPFGMAFALIGLLYDWHAPRLRQPFQPRTVMRLWLVTALALAAIQDSNINRINLIWLPLVYFAAVGLASMAKTRFVAAALVTVHLGLFVNFAATYFGDYRDKTASAFFPSFGQAVNAASDAVPGKICVTNSSVCMPYALVLFYRRIDPHQFIATVDYAKGDDEFQDVNSFDRYTFGLDRCPADTQAFIIDKGDIDRYRDRSDSIREFDHYAVAIAKATNAATNAPGPARP